jgi:hypothetical protein
MIWNNARRNVTHHLAAKSISVQKRKNRQAMRVRIENEQKKGRLVSKMIVFLDMPKFMRLWNERMMIGDFYERLTFWEITR